MLRPYQSQALIDIRYQYAQGTKKVLLHLPTGSGKTLIFCQVARQALDRGRRVIIIVRGRKLISQASLRLKSEGVAHGVFMANHPGYAPEKYVQVCSIDTIRSRKQYPKADLVIIDEADQATSPDFQALAKHYEDKFFLAVTATPYGTKSLRHIADSVVCPATVRDLITQDYLVDAKYFAPTKPDLSQVKITAGEYNESDLEKVMGRSQIVGDVVESWLKHANGLPSLVFCVSVAHAHLLCTEFKKKNVRACVLSAKHGDRVRDEAIDDLRTGQMEVICSVGIMGRGVDIPWLKCISLARPTRSLNLHLQQLGRLTRPYESKTHGLVLDHSGNLGRHGFMDDDFTVDLDGQKKKFKDSAPVTTCKNCFAIYRRKDSPNKCPECGADTTQKRGPGIPEQVPGELREISDRKVVDNSAIQHSIHVSLTQWFEYHKGMLKADGSEYSPWWVYKKVEALYPEHKALVSYYFKKECYQRGFSLFVKSRE